MITVTICSSTKFKEECEYINKELTRRGIAVYGIGWFYHYYNETPTRNEKKIMDMLHLEKIKNSSMIIVVAPNGYIGKSVSKEIQYALKNGKRVLKIIKFIDNTTLEWIYEHCKENTEDDITC